MAKKTEVVVTMTDDLDGGKADSSVTFAFEGSSYEIDLGKRNLSAMQKAFAPYISAARKVPSARRSPTRSAPARSSKEDLSAIREWAKANGHQVSDRGRIASDVQEAYRAAH
jgi:hypothetical protein